MGVSFYGPALELVAQHSRRWKSLVLICSSSDLLDLSGANGALPLLENLEVAVYDAAYPIRLFEVAPRLKTFTISGIIPPTLIEPYLGQLHTAGCIGQFSTGVPAAVACMSRMTLATKFHLGLYLSDWTATDVEGIDLPPTSSAIGSLVMEVRDYFEAPHCVKALSDIFTSCTFPHLRDLSFRSSEYPFSLMYWSHVAFLGLARRSAFQNHLHSLDLCHVVVDEAQLVSCLKALPSLQRLAISDRQIVRFNDRHYGVDMLLVTDSLFSKLSLPTSDSNSPRLVPQLRSLTCQSLLQFDDNVYLNFLLSRRPLAASNSPPFYCQLVWMRRDCREFDPGVVARLRELRIQKEVLSELVRAEHWME
jgi:hypothetical protein